MVVKNLAVSSEQMWQLCRINQDYPIGISCNSKGKVWGCTGLGRSKPENRVYLSDFPVEVISHVLILYPAGGRLKLSERIGGIFTVSKCLGRNHSEPLVWLTEIVKPIEAVWPLPYGSLGDEALGDLVRAALQYAASGPDTR